MENAATMDTLLCGIGLQLQGLLDAGHNEQFERIIYNASSDFHITFPDNKEYFAIFCEDGVLKYFAFNTEEEAASIHSPTNSVIRPNTVLYHAVSLKWSVENMNFTNIKK